MHVMYRKANGDEIIYDHTNGELTYGFVRRDGTDYPPQIIEQLLARGYWEVANDVSKAFDPEQERDERGRWTSTAGESVSGLYERKGLIQAVNNRVKGYLEDNYDSLVARGLVNPSQEEYKQTSSAAKAMVMEDIANRMRNVEIEDIATTVQELYPIDTLEDTGLLKLSPTELVSVIDDEDKILMFDGRYARVYDVAHPPILEEGILKTSPEDKETAIREYLASTLVNNWAQSSNDSNDKSLAIQEIAKIQFGIEDSADWKIGPSEQNHIYGLMDRNGTVIEAFLDAQYDSTQAFLQKNEVTEVTLFRGMDLTPDHDGNIPAPIGDNVEVAMRPLSSWSTSDFVATSFGSHIFTSTLPAERIFSLPTTGFGCRIEDEVVVLGGVTKAEVENINDYLQRASAG